VVKGDDIRRHSYAGQQYHHRQSSSFIVAHPHMIRSATASSSSCRCQPSVIVIVHHYPMRTGVITQPSLIRTCRAPQQ
jgi:hypothetical protein